MNEVKCNINQKIHDLPTLQGSIWEYESFLYILAKVNTKEWALMSFEDGNRLHNPSADYEVVTKNASFIAKSAKIIIEY